MPFIPSTLSLLRCCIFALGVIPGTFADNLCPTTSPTPIQIPIRNIALSDQSVRRGIALSLGSPAQDLAFVVSACVCPGPAHSLSPDILSHLFLANIHTFMSMTAQLIAMRMKHQFDALLCMEAHLIETAPHPGPKLQVSKAYVPKQKKTHFRTMTYMGQIRCMSIQLSPFKTFPSASSEPKLPAEMQ